MKIKFLVEPKGRSEYKAGAVVDFRGKVEEGYARKYIERGWAERIDRSKPAVDAEADVKATADQAKDDAEAKAKADADAKMKADADAKAKAEADAKAKVAAAAAAI
ncbi:hypothetical protein ACRAVF_33855 (plasmid) [Bradyrhizobium oligotrophicum S58]